MTGLAGDVDEAAADEDEGGGSEDGGSDVDEDVISDAEEPEPEERLAKYQALLKIAKSKQFETKAVTARVILLWIDQGWYDLFETR